MVRHRWGIINMVKNNWQNIIITFVLLSLDGPFLLYAQLHHKLMHSSVTINVTHIILMLIFKYWAMLIIYPAVKTCLLDNVMSNNLLNPNQSADFKYHSTETTLLSLHIHLTNAIFHHKVSCLCCQSLCCVWYNCSFHSHSITSPPGSANLTCYTILSPGKVVAFVK